MCVGIGGFGNEILGRAARGEGDFPDAMETNRNVETIRGRCMMMMVEVWGVGDGRWGGGWIILWRRVTSYPPSLDGPQAASLWIAGVTCRNGCPPHLSPLGVCRNPARSREPPYSSLIGP